MKKDFLSINIFLKPKNNLSFVGCKRLILTSSTHTKTPITPNILDQFSYTQLNEVLSNIHSFRNDVTIQDLKTAYVMCFLRKIFSKKFYKRKYRFFKKTNYGIYVKTK
jgi:hypothetical protein